MSEDYQFEDIEKMSIVPYFIYFILVGILIIGFLLLFVGVEYERLEQGNGFCFEYKVLCNQVSCLSMNTSKVYERIITCDLEVEEK